MFSDLAVLGQLTAQTDEGVGTVVAFLYIAIIVLTVVAWWKVFEKANQPGWGAIIPIYNVILLLKIAGKPLWWLVLMLIPIISIIPGIMIPMSIARNFGKSGMFGVGLIFLPFIFYPILAFGDAEYAPSI